MARAAAAAGIAQGLSLFASKPLAEVAAANSNVFFQVYWMGGRARVAQMLEYARQNGANGIVVTLDWRFAHRRDWGSPSIPDNYGWRTKLRFLLRSSHACHGRDFYRAGGPPALTVPNLARDGDAPGSFAAYRAWMMTPLSNWDDIAWMRQQWDGPFMIKGVAHPDEARHAVRAGATAISVSNHGGNNVDGTPAALRRLLALTNAVGDQIEVILDGGIRRGTDVVKAPALGARAVMTGRALLWGLAANGQSGGGNVLEILRAGIDETLVGIGRAPVQDVVPEDVLMNAGFTRQTPGWLSAI